MINCTDCKYYDKNPYLSCAVNPLEVASGSCDMGEPGDKKEDALSKPFRGLDSIDQINCLSVDLLEIGIPEDELQQAGRVIIHMTLCGIKYAEALDTLKYWRFSQNTLEAAEDYLKKAI
jgi:hypothetical protein